MNDIGDYCEGGYRYCSTMKRIAELEAWQTEAARLLNAAWFETVELSKQRHELLSGYDDKEAGGG